MMRLRTGKTASFLAMLGVACLLIGAAEAPPESANHLRLHAMPLAERKLLSQRLQEFDERLSPTQQAALRSLDRQINEASPEVRARFLLLAHRYRIWLDSLTDAERASVQSGSPADRLAAVRKLLNSLPGVEFQRADTAAALSPILNPYSLIDQAHAIAVWLALTPQEKAEVSHAPAADRLTKLNRLGKQHGVEDRRPVQITQFEKEIKNRAALRPFLTKKAEAAKATVKAEVTKRELEAWMLIRHKFALVEPAPLDRFIAALPPFILSSLDSLPPEAANKRLAILYRLVFADGEMPAPSPEEKRPADTPGAKTKPEPRPEAGTGASPF